MNGGAAVVALKPMLTADMLAVVFDAGPFAKGAKHGFDVVDNELPGVSGQFILAVGFSHDILLTDVAPFYS
jgi:hypothetical protein